MRAKTYIDDDIDDDNDNDDDYDDYDDNDDDHLHAPPWEQGDERQEEGVEGQPCCTEPRSWDIATCLKLNYD